MLNLSVIIVKSALDFTYSAATLLVSV